MRTAVSAFLLFVALCSAVAETSLVNPVTCSELLTLLASGVPNQRIARIVSARKIGFAYTPATMMVLSRAGMSTNLSNLVQGLASGSHVGADEGCSTSLTEIASSSHAQDFSSAEDLTGKLLRRHPENPALHLALGYLLRQQNNLDEAFDAYSDAKELDPGNPEIHNGLAHIFFASSDAEGTIGEARTALSIDPQNAEAHGLLGLGLFLDEKYDAAMNAFEEALTRDPKDAEAYFGIGLTQRALGQLSSAARAFHRSIQLDPDSGDAQRELELVLIDLDRKDNKSAAGSNLPSARGMVPSFGR